MSRTGHSPYYSARLQLPRSAGRGRLRLRSPPHVLCSSRYLVTSLQTLINATAMDASRLVVQSDTWVRADGVFVMVFSWFLSFNFDCVLCLLVLPPVCRWLLGLVDVLNKLKMKSVLLDFHWFISFRFNCDLKVAWKLWLKYLTKVTWIVT